ncbi:MAG TPA: aldo/keto reductase [Anaerolineae bacterium]|nr:aldo/keto reductase [Anaerolineae bacterium]
MHYRTLGKAGFQVSEIGYGAWGIGADWWKGCSDEECLDALDLAIDLGVTFIDTAMGYGDGHSERLIGKVLRERQEPVRIATKIRPMNFNFAPKPGDSFEEAYTKEWIIECTEQSLANLGQEQLDMQMLHVWLDEWADREEWKEAISRLKEQGKVRAFGLSLVFPLETAHLPRQAIASGVVDFCQVVYNIYQQEPQDELFPLALRENIGIIARCPLDEGALTGKITPETTFPEDDWRNDYFRGERKLEVNKRAQALQWLIHGDVETLAEAALRFCLSQPAVSTVIAGMRRPDHVLANVRASDKGALPAEDLKRLKDHAWPHNFWV